jgi:hypothetical protein
MMTETLSFDIGMVESRARVRPDFAVNAVVIELLDYDYELVMSPPSAVDVLLRMIAALEALNGLEDTD